MTTHQHLSDFARKHNLQSEEERPNWMQLKFSEQLNVHPPVMVVIDHKSAEARRALGALISHLWLSCENWTIVTNRPE